ncbi:M14 family metallopeptidase [Zongyangia hominis]|uniref:Gamma-D-glutamyl-meso-diaminopimelate peptidase n=1 Tax=Zongyangia hominis TaxID=2763677 RepID=A0A926EA13_9FIRM|nr:M14 family metallocarboxypeptidase [Zongyangia hominis]MBC8570680.1 gamma-D-glutamyl-meso-diaminopimelate peptidase [Zongyangia hominis]
MEQSREQPFGYAQLEEQILAIKKKGGPVKAFTIGKTVLGRNIYALGMGKLRQAALMVGATHGLEWVTSRLLMMFAGELMEALEEGKSLCAVDPRKVEETRGLIIVPMLNPDGVEIAQHGAKGCMHLAKRIYEICDGHFEKWQANARGVDLNHNFDAGWDILKQMEISYDILKPAPTRFGGHRPMSEPETKAIAQLISSFDVKTLYSFHSQGEEIYYHYGPNTPHQSKLMAQILASSSGYTLSEPEGIASHGGLKDYFIQKYSRPGFTIEVGKGRNPLPDSDAPAIYEKIREMLTLAMIL